MVFPYHGERMKVVVFTLGCKVNSCESGSLMAGLEKMGYEVSDELSYADIYIINTCAVTSEAEKKSRQAIARVKKFNNNAKIIVTGCASQNDPNSFINKENVTLVTGTKSKEKILELLDFKGVNIYDHDKIFDDMPFPKITKTRGYIKIQDGCNYFCSYCLIPYLRGRSRSRDPESILKEIRELKCLEVVLTAINLSDYNYNGIDLTRLINLLKDENIRIRLGSVEQGIVEEDFLISLSNLKDFAPHFHLSLQSGSDEVLKKMNRKYFTEDFRKSIKLIRKYFPTAGITTDVIVGFPGETEENFIETYDFCKEVEFSDIHCFPFSPRKGTVAYKMKDVEPSVKKNRLDRLLQLKSQLHNGFITKNIGRKEEVVFEEFDGLYSIGYTGNYIKVYLKDKCINKKKYVIIKEPFKDGVIVELEEI